MDFKALLNTDVAVLSHGAERLWRWWIGELRSLASLGRGASGPKSRLIAELRGDDLVFREYRRTVAIAIPRHGPVDKMLANATFALPDGTVLTREVGYPPLPPADLRRIAALDIDRLTPFMSGDVLFDLDAGRTGRNTAELRVELGIIRRRTFEDILARLRAFGAEPKAISLVDHHDGSPRFDFLNCAPIAGRRSLFGLRAGYWWAIASALFLLNCGLLITKDVYSLSSLRGVVQMQRNSVVLASALRRRVELEDNRRARVVASLDRASPLAVLNAVTQALPDSVWVQHFEWNGKLVRLVGMAPAGLDVAALVRASPVIQGRTELVRAVVGSGRAPPVTRRMPASALAGTRDTSSRPVASTPAPHIVPPQQSLSPADAAAPLPPKTRFDVTVPLGQKS